MLTAKPTLREIFDTSEAADEVVRHSLKWHYHYLTLDNERLSQLDELADHEAQDFANNVRDLQAIKTVLKMFGVQV